MGFDRVTRAFERGVLEIAPLAFMRGRTLNQAFVILDEAQNTTPEQMKMFLTRIGFGCQGGGHGRHQPDGPAESRASGLVDAERVLAGVKGIAFTRFTSADVVRHPLVARIVDAYDARGSSGTRSAAGLSCTVTLAVPAAARRAPSRHRCTRARVARWLRAALASAARNHAAHRGQDEALALEP